MQQSVLRRAALGFRAAASWRPYHATGRPHNAGAAAASTTAHPTTTTPPPPPPSPPPEHPEYRTQRRPVYTLPYYGAPEEEIQQLDDATTERALRSYGGLVRPRKDTGDELRARLVRLTRAAYRPKLLTISGHVVSDRMHKSVVIAARRAAYSTKYRVPYFRTRRFMAHDEHNLCREGDLVVIRSCRPLSNRKAHVVVQNYGDKRRTDVDDRADRLQSLVEAVPTPLADAANDPRPEDKPTDPE